MTLYHDRAAAASDPSGKKRQLCRQGVLKLADKLREAEGLP